MAVFEPRTRVAQTLATTALLVLVLGVLPFLWDAPGVWRVLGPAAAALFAVHAVRVVWHEAFSTRHLTGSR
ncbi:hypothetical protein [Blastococcus sp. SYSU D00813]